MKEEIECYEGSSNVFADIGLKDADELFARAQIGVEVLKILKERKLKQREIENYLVSSIPKYRILSTDVLAVLVKENY